MEMLEPDRDGVYAIVFDGGLDVEFVSLTDKLLLVRSAVADVPEDRDAREDFFRTHLQQNLLALRDQTATLSLDSEKGVLWLHRTAALDRSDFRAFCDLLEDFVNTVEWWQNLERRNLNSYGAPASALAMPYNMLRP